MFVHGYSYTSKMSLTFFNLDFTIWSENGQKMVRKCISLNRDIVVNRLQIYK